MEGDFFFCVFFSKIHGFISRFAVFSITSGKQQTIGMTPFPGRFRPCDRFKLTVLCANHKWMRNTVVEVKNIIKEQDEGWTFELILYRPPPQL